MTKLFNMTSLEKSNLRLKVQKYAHDAFSYDKTIQDWHDTANNLISNWKSNKRSSYTVNTL